MESQAKRQHFKLWAEIRPSDTCLPSRAYSAVNLVTEGTMGG